MWALGRRELIQTGSDKAVTVGTLNINMYMDGNEMSMTDTKFTMNIQGKKEEAELLQSATGQSFVTRGKVLGDLSRLALLTVASFRQSIKDNAKAGKPNNSADSVWSWLQEWSGKAKKAKSNTLDINMRMAGNKMSMEGTVFTFNVNRGKKEVEVLVEEKQEGAAATLVSEAAAANSKKYLYSKSKSMDNVNFQMDVGKRRLMSMKAKATSPSASSVDMYMDENTMTMTNTIFTMNVGAGAGKEEALMQAEELDGVAKQTMNVNSLNINMYMTDNKMSMKKTTFTQKRI